MADRRTFREQLMRADEPAVLAPLTLDPLTARLCERLGFGAGYVSGGGLGYQLAVSEALLTLTELAAVVAAIVRRSSLPIIVDGGVGFGDPVHVARAMWELEAAGAVEILDSGPVTPAYHLMGTARMGADPRRSVVNASHRAHDVPNLYVVDGSSFATSAAVNPTSTIGHLRCGQLTRSGRSRRVSPPGLLENAGLLERLLTRTRGRASCQPPK